MDFLTIIIALAIPAVTGTLLVSLILGEDAGAGEKVFLGFGTGLGVLSYEMFLTGLLRVPFSVAGITVPQLVLMAVLAAVMYARLKPSRMRAPEERGGVGIKGFEVVLAAVMAVWVLLKIGFVFYESVNRPIYSWDTWANWSAGAKFFFYSRGLVLDPSSEHFFGAGYRAFLGHPLHSVLLQVYSALWLGAFDEIYVKSWTPFYFVSMLGIVYVALKREAGVFYGVAGAFSLASFPFLTWHAQDAYSDFPLSWYSLAAFVTFWRYMLTGNGRFLVLSGALSGMGMFVKNEGLFFVMALGAVLVLYSIFERKPLVTNLFYFSLPVLVLAGPWLVFKSANDFGFGHTGSELKWLGDPTIRGGERTGVHWDIIVPALKQVFLTANFSLLFPFWIAVSALGMRTVARSEIKYLNLAILVVIAGFVFVYLTLENMSVIEGTGIHRNILTYAPIILFTSALTLNGVRERRRG
jgi:hypothetical protein